MKDALQCPALAQCKVWGGGLPLSAVSLSLMYFPTKIEHLTTLIDLKFC